VGSRLDIKSISRWEFAQLVPQGYLLERIFGEKVEWWAGECGGILGTIARNERERRWFYIVLLRENDDHYRVCGVQSGFESQQAARVRLIRAMKLVVGGGKELSRSAVVARN
jgi:hypothetical protein